jgi:SpoVK/Ycf46/Vps4 family AAA+-type ATPase
MRISQIKKALATAHKADLSVFLKGSPGTAKTAIVRQFAKEQKLKLISIHAPLTDLLDIKGVISTQNDEACFLPLSIWPKPSDKPVVILIDELPQCVPAIQNAFSQLLIDKKMGDITLPKGSIVIATGNRKEDKAATHNVPSHVINRVMHIEVDRSNEDFFNWALSNKIEPEIVAFGHFKPDCVYNFDPRDNQNPYATYRSWEFASNILKTKPDDDLVSELLAGVVGKSVAAEFLAYRRLYKDLPDPQEILANPLATMIPQDPGTLYAISTALAAAVDEATVKNYFTFMDRLPTEFAVMSVKSSRNTYPKITKAKEFGAWAKTNSSIIL